MPLPEIIEIAPLQDPVRAEITVPGSKSITNRALILAALSEGEVRLEGALWSEDTQVMVEALRELGFVIRVEPDPDEFCNRHITVQGLAGRIPKAGTPEEPLELFVGNAGTAARFLTAMVCLGNGVYRLSGVPRMHERPQAALFEALRELGYRVDSANDKLPAVIHGQRRNQQSAPRRCSVSIEQSSQFASALLLCAKEGAWEVNILGENADESPYVVMTAELVNVFPKVGKLQIEPDASSGSYFWTAGWENPTSQNDESTGIRRFETSRYEWVHSPEVFRVVVRRWPSSHWQIDQNFPGFLFGPPAVSSSRVTSRNTDLGDSIMTAITIAPLSSAECIFTDLGRLRVQECERVVALRTELTKCGARVSEDGDTLRVYPSRLHGAEIETYNDHRMAMCFAILGLKVPEIRIKNPTCVKKTFPNFFQKLALSPPHGLGAKILDGNSGRELKVQELFAE